MSSPVSLQNIDSEPQERLLGKASPMGATFSAKGPEKTFEGDLNRLCSYTGETLFVN